MSATFRRIIPPAVLRRQLRDGAGQGVRMAGEMLRRDANTTCPIDTGTLRNSASVTFAGSNAATARATVSYGTPYAIIVHEKPGLHYQGSGRYKWLALTGEENRAKYGDVIAQAVRGSMP